MLRFSDICAPDVLCRVVVVSITRASTSLCGVPSTKLAIARRKENFPTCGWCCLPFPRFSSSCMAISVLISARRHWISPNSFCSPSFSIRVSLRAPAVISFERVASWLRSSRNSVILFSLGITQIFNDLSILS